MSELTSSTSDSLSPPPAEGDTPAPAKPFLTQAIIAINILVFLWMVAHHVPFFDPDADQVLPFGANLGPLVTSGEWWRLLTACFLHFGVIHIAMNMIILYQVGLFTEILFGNVRFLILYLVAGLAGNIAGLYVHPYTISAGASGAVFGVYGGLLGFLLIRRGVVDTKSAKSVAISAFVFLGYNLIYSLGSASTDLTAHAAGVFAGFVAGCALAWSLAPAPPSTRMLKAVAATAALAFVTYFSAVHAPHSSPAQVAWFRAFSAPSVTIGNEGLLRYTGTATSVDAQALAKALLADGFFKNKGVSMLYHREASSASVAIPFVGDESKAPDPKKPLPWKDPAMLKDLELAGPSFATAAQTVPFTVRLLNGDEDLRTQIPIDTFEVLVGTDKVDYSNRFTAQQATALGTALQSIHFWKNVGSRAILTRTGDTPEIALFVVNSNFDEPSDIAYYQRLGHTLAPAIGGLPLSLHLTDHAHHTEKYLKIE